MLRALAFGLAMLASTGAPIRAEHAKLDHAKITLLTFQDLTGWPLDDHDKALSVFQTTCAALNNPDWRPLCSLAKDQADARTFFELFFVPVLIEDGQPPLFTAYFEPTLRGSRRPTAVFRYPVYAMPPELQNGTAWFTRREIIEGGILANRGLEIVWVDDPVALQFLQIQGSGRIMLANGTSIRLGYAGSNGRRFRSLGDELVRRGVYTQHQVSATVIGNWVRRNPIMGAELLLHNSSFVFFREIGRVAANLGPLGAMNRSITANRSVAVDPAYTPLGAPVWLEKAGADPFARLMIAQDTGSRVKGAQRADIFFGTGDQAGLRAAQISDTGRMVVFLPIQHAYTLAPEG